MGWFSMVVGWLVGLRRHPIPDETCDKSVKRQIVWSESASLLSLERESPN